MKTKFIFGIFLYAASMFPPFGGTKGGCQNISINTTGAAANASALLDVDDGSANNVGMLIPRIALSNVATQAPIGGTAPASLIVYNTSSTTTNGSGEGYYYWNGSNKWIYIPAPSNSPGTSGQVLLSNGINASPSWGTLSTSGACLPTQISNAYWGAGGAAFGGGNATVNWMTCGTNCAAYAGTGAGDGGFTDWRMPTAEEYAYARQQFAAPTSGWIGNYFWTRFIYPNIASGYWFLLHESTGNATGDIYSNTYYCRCVR